jgi:hypothetical protein
VCDAVSTVHRPRTFSLAEEWLVHVRTRSSVLRILHVYPSHTPYTRVQLLHVLLTSLYLNLLFIALFLGRDAETCSIVAQVHRVRYPQAAHRLPLRRGCPRLGGADDWRRRLVCALHAACALPRAVR